MGRSDKWILFYFSRSLNFVGSQGVEIINMHTQTVRCVMFSKLMK